MNFRENIQKLKKFMEAVDLRVGDKVIIIGDLETKGLMGVIEDIAPKGGFYLINVGGKKGYYYQKDLKFVKREALFQVGEKVRTSEGMVGIITRIDYKDSLPILWVNNKYPLSHNECSRVK